jgi:hypothetical protein
VCGIASYMSTFENSWWVCLAESSSTLPNSPSIAVLSDYMNIEDGLTLPWIILQLCKLARPLLISHKYFIASLLLGLIGLSTTVFNISPNNASSNKHTSDLY